MAWGLRSKAIWNLKLLELNVVTGFVHCRLDPFLLDGGCDRLDGFDRTDVGVTMHGAWGSSCEHEPVLAGVCSVRGEER
jgi:hypothetical protein